MRPLILILLFALLVISQINTILDADLWWNLKSGEYILKNLEIPRADIFSYTLHGREWVDHAWLSQILFYIIFTLYGCLGLNILKALIVSSCFLILFLISYGGNRKIFYPVFFIMLSVLAFGYRSFVRPELFSYLLFCAFLYILEKEKRLYFLPFLQILLVNMHGYFILGPLLVFLYAMGEFLSGNKIRSRKLGYVFLATCAAVFINPNFYKGAIYPAAVFIKAFTSHKIYMQDVSELMPPARSGFGRYVFFWILAVISSITFLINLKKAKLRHILVFSASFLAAYTAVRNMPIFIFAAMPLGSINLEERGAIKNINARKYYSVLILAICWLIYFFMSGGYYISLNQSGLRKTESRFSAFLMPSGACDFLEKNNIKGRIFNTMDFGPYIGYRFYPEKRIFIDTRTELYGEDLYKFYRRAQNYPKELENLQKEYSFNIALLRHLFSDTARLLKYLYAGDKWALVYYDRNSAVFLQKIPENSAAIEKFQINFKEKKLEAADTNINTAMFFEKIGELKSAEEIYVKLLEADPRFLQAGDNLSTIYINAGRTDDAMKLLQRLLKYHPDSPELYADMGALYLSMGEKERGISVLKKSLKMNPYLRQASYALGKAYLQIGDAENAFKQFSRYLELDPYDGRAHRLLGDIYKQKGLFKEAGLEYNEADKLEGK